MKKITVLLAAVLAGGLAFLAGCTSAIPKTGTTANWDVTFADDENWKERVETAEYTLSFEKGGNATYSVEYDVAAAKYVTRLSGESFDWNADTVADYRSESAKSEFVYVYETELNISGKFIHASSGDEKPFSDYVKTVAKFRKAGANLAPVYSYQVVKCHTPAALNAGSIGAAYVEVDSVYETFYNEDGDAAIVKTADNLKTDGAATEEKDGLKASGYSLFDKNALEIVLRSLTKSSGYQFDVFVPQNGGIMNCQANCSEATLLDLEKSDEKQIFDALEASTPADYIFVGSDGEGVKQYKYNRVTLGFVSQMTGPSSTYWFAATENGDVSASKAVLLKAVTPLSFGLGTINYTLSSLKLTEKN